MATWCRGNDDFDPSAKMLALIEQLQIAENDGDKTIVYSQCMPFRLIYLLRSSYVPTMTVRDRDIDAGFVGDTVGAVRDPEFAVRREDAERDARRGARCVPQDGRAQSDPDQHQVRRRQFEPHIRQSRHQVRGDPSSFSSQLKPF